MELAPTPHATQLEARPAPEHLVIDTLGELAMLDDVADDLDDHALAASTRRYYEADFAQYVTWCARMGCAPLPCDPEDVRLYLTDLSLQMRPDGTPRYRASTIERHLASLSRINYDHGHGRELARHPRVTRTMAGIRNARQEKTDRKRPLLLADLTRLIASMEHHRWPTGVTAARDTFAFSLAFATAMRREELTGLTLRQVHLAPVDGLWIRLGRSKTDQAGHGTTLAVPFGQHTITCVPCAWVRWLRLLAAEDSAARRALVEQTPADPADWQHVCHGRVPILDGAAPLLRSVTKAGAIGTDPLSTSGINQALKRRLTTAGYDPSGYGMHSWRAGFVTQARRNGVDSYAVRRQTRHTSDAMVDVYTREWLPLERNAVVDLGL